MSGYDEFIRRDEGNLCSNRERQGSIAKEIAFANEVITCYA